MDSAVGKRQIFEDDYHDDYWWHSSASASQFEQFETDMLICIGCQCCEVVHRGCYLLGCLSVVHRRLLSCAKKNKERRTPSPIS